MVYTEVLCVLCRREKNDREQMNEMKRAKLLTSRKAEVGMGNGVSVRLEKDGMVCTRVISAASNKG